MTKPGWKSCPVREETLARLAAIQVAWRKANGSNPSIADVVARLLDRAEQDELAAAHAARDDPQ